MTGTSDRAPIPVVIDGDPGIDDAVALALAVVSPEIDVLAVTTLAGNAPVDVTTDNARRLLHLLGRDDIPVAAGADRALVHVGVHNQISPHGVNGLGDVELPPAACPAVAEHAVDVLAGILRRAAPRSVTIAALGPLTNLALLLALHPDLSERIKEVVAMGGTSERGNITPVAEFNVWADPEAAHRVLADSGLDIRLVGLDVTRRATIDGEGLSVLRSASDRGAVLTAMVAAYGSYGLDGWALHDVLTVASIIDPALVRTRAVDVDVDTGLGPTRGQTAFRAPQPRPAPTTGVGVSVTPTRVRMACDVDVAGFRALVLTRVAEDRSDGRPPPDPDRVPIAP